MDRMLIAQRDFSSGQIDETALRRDDSDLLRSALRVAQNVRLLNSGACRRRPGRRIVYRPAAASFGIKPATNERWWMDFNEGVVVFRRVDGSAFQVIDGRPWTPEMIPELEWDIAAGTVIVAHQSMWPHIFRLNIDTGVWSASEFRFATEFNAIGSREPFYAFNGGQKIQMKPTARTGVVTVAFDAPVLTPAHVGARFRYAGQQMIVRSVVSVQEATMEVVGQLPATLQLLLDNVEGLQVGDVVEGVTSGASGFVTSLVPGVSSVEVIMNRNWQSFQQGEYVAGPRSRAKVNVVGTSPQEPAPSLVWDESFISEARGFPGSVTFDRQRLIFSRFKQFGGAICYSAIGSLTDFLVGASASDAIFEYVPQSCQVLYVTGGEDQFVFTDVGAYFTPISASSPLAPGSIDYRRISNDAAATIRPKLTAEGTVFINSGRNRVLAIVPTGQQTKPYAIRDLTQNHADLIKSPTSIAVTSTDKEVPERYLYVCNSDGTLAVARYDGGKEAVGWVPWSGQGRIASVTTLEDLVAVAVDYGSTRLLEVFDEARKLDASLPMANSLLQPGFDWAAGRSVSVMDGGWYRGDVAVGAGGTLAEFPPVLSTANAYVGISFDVVVVPFVPNAPDGQARRQRMRPRRITQVAATVLHTTAITVAGRLIPMWLAGENEEFAPPARQDTYRARIFGRSYEPAWSVTQTIPGDFTLLELATEVTA